MQPTPLGHAAPMPVPAPSVPAARPTRVAVAAAFVIGSALVALGIVAVIVSHIVNYGAEFLYDMPILFLIPGIAWLGVINHGLMNGRAWSRFAAAMTLPMQVPFYALFVVLVSPSVYAPPAGETGPIATMRVVALLLCYAGVLLGVATPLLLLGPDVAAWVKRDVR